MSATRDTAPSAAIATAVTPTVGAGSQHWQRRAAVDPVQYAAWAAGHLDSLMNEPSVAGLIRAPRSWRESSKRRRSSSV